jgi:hypothetical protein
VKKLVQVADEFVNHLFGVDYFTDWLLKFKQGEEAVIVSPKKVYMDMQRKAERRNIKKSTVFLTKILSRHSPPYVDRSP